MALQLPESWREILAGESDQPYFLQLQEFLEQERAQATVYPPEHQVFAALENTPFPNVKVLLLGQDPYHDEGQAHGLAFSVRPRVKPPPSLVNIFKEVRDEFGCAMPDHGCLLPWARQGVLLLNSVLTVRAHEPNSHKGKGWEKFTDAIVRRVNEKPERVVFLLWGGNARKKAGLIDTSRHFVIECAHPSPLSAYGGFFGSRPFSAANKALIEAGRQPIDWCLPKLNTQPKLFAPSA